MNKYVPICISCLFDFIHAEATDKTHSFLPIFNHLLAKNNVTQQTKISVGDERANNNTTAGSSAEDESDDEDDNKETHDEVHFIEQISFCFEYLANEFLQHSHDKNIFCEMFTEYITYVGE